jgi:tetratricopeptide (TPR) repeat protein
MEVKMKMKWLPIFLIVVWLGGCSVHNVSKSEFDFANKLAKQGLWKEAQYRWERALKKGQETAAIYNNIAVSMEEAGKFDEAEKMYQKALSLSPNNSSIKSNYDRLKKLLKNEPDDKTKDEKKKDKKMKEKERI